MAVKNKTKKQSSRNMLDGKPNEPSCTYTQHSSFYYLIRYSVLYKKSALPVTILQTGN